MDTVAQNERSQQPEFPEQQLEDGGYRGVHRSALATEAERRGWDEAYGEDCYFRELWEEQQELNSIGRDESLRPWQY